MGAQKICNKVLNEVFQEDGLIGQVHSVFKKACNIITKQGEMITVLSSEKTMTPRSILLDKEFDFTESGFIQGDNVISDKESIIIRDVKYRINVKGATPWDSKPDFNYVKDSIPEIQKKLNMVEKCIFSIGNLEGIAPILVRFEGILEDIKVSTIKEAPSNQYCQFIGDSLERFIYLVIKKDIEKISEASKYIIGFGPGLTPSTDDFVAGLMTSLIYVTEYFQQDISEIYELNGSIVREIENRTTRISEEMLKLASRGEVTEDIRTFLISLLSPSDEVTFVNNLINVLEYGSTSGTDTLSGLYIGCRIIFNEKKGGLL